MDDLINEIKTLFEYYNNGNYLFFVIFLLSIIYIFCTEKDRKVKDFFVGYSVVILFVIWNPICIKALNKFINFGSMYRIYFMLPNLFTIAYSMAKMMEKSKKIYKFISVFVIGAIIVYFGNTIFLPNNIHTFVKYSNYYKLPDEEVEVAYKISGDKQTDYKKAIVPYGMSSRIRQIDGSIQLVYTRVISSPKDENGNSLPHDSDDASNYEPVQKLNAGDVKYIVNLCKRTNTNYVVFDKAVTLSDNMEKYGYKLFSETQSYSIYRLESSVKE